MTRNLVLVTIDSLRADHLGSYGYDRDTSPQIDQYADSGHRFTAAFSHACATRPAFPGILASSHALMYGGFEQISQNQTLVSEALSAEGYTTGGFHSNPYLSREFGYSRGFDTFFESAEDPSAITKLRDWVKNNLDTDGYLFGALQQLYDTVERETGVNVGTYHTSAENITDRAIEWLEGQSSEPQFLWVHYMDPHHPFIPPEEHQQFSDVDRREGVRLRPKMVENPDSITDEELGSLIDLYDDEIHYTDDQVGRLLSNIEAHWEDWTAVITADHGEEFRDHGDFAHSNRFFEETMHVPLIVYDGETSGTHDEIVGHADIAPTLVRWAGSDTLPDAFWGYSLNPLLNDRSDEWPRKAVRGSWCDLPECTRRLAYRTIDWKYIRDNVNDREKLYDLNADPDERENLIATADDIPGVVETFREEVDNYEDEIASTSAETDEVEMDQQTREQLRRLGYAE